MIRACRDSDVAFQDVSDPSQEVFDLHFALCKLAYQNRELCDTAGYCRFCFANGDCYELLEMGEERPNRIRRCLDGAETECTAEVLEMISALLSERSVRVPAPLDENTERQMAADFLGFYGESLHYDAYYGSYGDCAVLYLDSNTCAVGKITINGIVFQNHSLFTLLVWHDHAFCTLENACRGGLISDSDLRKIAVIHILHHNRITAWNTDPNDIYES